MGLPNLQPTTGSKYGDNSRKGRGHGLSNSKTVGRGHKGQRARSGTTRPGFEGGQMSSYRRLPKYGFISMDFKTIVGINVNALERSDNDTEVTVETSIKTGIAKNPRDGTKILGNGGLTKELTVKASVFNEGVKSKVEALDGACGVV